MEKLPYPTGRLKDGIPRTILFDTTTCIGCRQCVQACKDWNELPRGSMFSIQKNTWLVMNPPGPEGGAEGNVWVRGSCMHCQFPMCAAVCPVEAITKFEEGPVVINKETCIGCKYCVYACPWDVIAFDEGSGKATKCTMCNDRITEGKEPFCVKICPADALHFGTYDNMLATAESRATSTGGFVYGKNDAGGTNVLYVLKPGLEKLLPNVPLEKFPRKKRPLSIDIMGILTKGGPRGKIRAIMSILRNPRRLKHRYF